MLLSTQTDFLSQSFGDEEALRFIRKMGFDAADFGMFSYSKNKDPMRFDDAEFTSYFSHLREVADSIGLIIGQTHSPFPTFAGDEDDGARLQMQRRAIRATSLLGCKYMVMHPAFPKGPLSDEKREDFFRINMERYGSLIPDLQEYGVKIAIENMFSGDPETGRFCETVCSSAEEMNRYIDTLNEQADCFVACLDLGHAMICGDKPQNMILKLGKRLKVLHVQDGDGTGDWHVVPHLGAIEWKKVMKTLRQAEYDGTFSLEADRFPMAFGAANKEECYALMHASARRILDL